MTFICKMDLNADSELDSGLFFLLREILGPIIHFLINISAEPLIQLFMDNLPEASSPFFGNRVEEVFVLREQDSINHRRYTQNDISALEFDKNAANSWCTDDNFVLRLFSSE